MPEIIPYEPDLDNASGGSLITIYPGNIHEYSLLFREKKMKKISLLLIASTLMISLLSCEKKQPVSKEAKNLVIYAYDSFVSEWGPGPKVIPLFEQKYGIKVEIKSPGDAGQVLSTAILEKDSPSADILIGIDNNMLSKAVDSGILSVYKSPELVKIDKTLVFDPTNHLTPYDYGYFSIIYNSSKISDPPESLEDLLKPEYEKSIILMDPRTSSPGLGFMLWTVRVFGDSFTDYWSKLSRNILTITDGWDSGYGLFVNGEAPMVLSYTTSPAYHMEYEESEQYKATIFKRGNYMQIEGAGIVENCRNRKSAELFIDFILSEDFQKEIPLTNWMFPVRDIKLPDSYSTALKPETGLLLDSKIINNNLDRWTDKWLETVNK